MQGGIIARVYEGGLAEELGIEAGDKILEINGQVLRDLIDLSFAMADEEIEMLVETKDGEREVIEFDKEYDEELGVEFESAVFDGIRRCGNRCCFCFVDQIAPHLRESLSVKDDDYRMSFLYGNFVTLTNLSEADFERIEKLHLSPLYVSVHVTDPGIREKMLGSKRAGEIMAQLKRLIGMGIEVHTQIVLCPEINDGVVLERTVRDLSALRPGIASLAIVPVGLTKYRESCISLRGFTAEEARGVIRDVEIWQSASRAKTGGGFVYLGDEFYLSAGAVLPSPEAYDGFPQLENGVGLTRNFIQEWKEAVDIDCNAYEQPIYLDVVCGTSAEATIRSLTESIAVPGLCVRVVAIENEFFGNAITVSGLLTGGDIAAALIALDGPRSGVVLPGAALRTGEAVFLDDMTLEELQQCVGVPIKHASKGGELRGLLAQWNAAREELPKGPYTWQSNCGYTKQ